MRVIVPNFVPIGQSIEDIWPFIDFSKWRPFTMDFQKFKLLTACNVRTLNMRHHAKIHANRTIFAEIWPYFDISRWRPRHLRFLKLQIQMVNGWTRRECRIASPGQISWRSVKPLPRHRDLWSPNQRALRRKALILFIF